MLTALVTALLLVFVAQFPFALLAITLGGGEVRLLDLAAAYGIVCAVRMLRRSDRADRLLAALQLGLAARTRAVRSGNDDVPGILRLHQLDCTHVVTVEGVAPKGTLSPVQESMVRWHGAQCGFCTPGFITAMTALYEGRVELTERDVRRGLTGNLCRCTGYEPIINAILAAAQQRGARRA